MQVLIVVLTMGSSAAAQVGGKFGKVVQVVRALDTAADPFAYASKLKHVAKLTPEATGKLRKALGKAGDTSETAVAKPGLTTTAPTHIAHGEGIDSGISTTDKPRQGHSGVVEPGHEASLLHDRLRARGIDSARIERLDGAFRTAGFDATSLAKLGDDALARLVDPKVLDELEAIAHLQQQGHVTGLRDWIEFGAAKTESDLGRVAGELREARRLVQDQPGSVINIGGDARAPLDPATGGPLASFDLTVEKPSGSVRRSVEVTTVKQPIDSAAKLTSGVRHATDKAKRHAAGQPIPAPRDATIRITLARQSSQGNKGTVHIDTAGNRVLHTRNGKRIAQGNILDQFPNDLSTIPSHEYLDRVTLVDAVSGERIAEYERAGAAWSRTH